jgi:hypothetical protein
MACRMRKRVGSASTWVILIRCSCVITLPIGIFTYSYIPFLECDVKARERLSLGAPQEASQGLERGLSCHGVFRPFLRSLVDSGTRKCR